MCDVKNDYQNLISLEIEESLLGMQEMNVNIHHKFIESSYLQVDLSNNLGAHTFAS